MIFIQKFSTILRIALFIISTSIKKKYFKEVINEIHITERGVDDYLKSSWITAKLLSKMTFDKRILSINYNIQTVNQIIYIMGIAQNQEELDRVIQHAKNIANVKKVINYVRIKR